MANKSFNADALLGDDYDDKQFQADYREMGVEIPDALLYTPEMNVFVAKAERERTKVDLVGKMNPASGAPFSAKEAEYEANENYKATINNLSQLSQTDLWKLGA